MAMYVTTQVNAPHGHIEEHCWHVGEQKFELERYKSVIHIQADGDELEEILTCIGGIPYATHKRVQSWRDGFAAFIWDNI